MGHEPHPQQKNSTTVVEPRQWQWQVQTPWIEQQQQQQQQQQQRQPAICNTHRISDPCVYHYSLSCCEHKSVVQTTLCSRGCDRWYTRSIAVGLLYICMSSAERAGWR